MTSKAGPFYNKNTSQPSEGCIIKDYYIESLIATTDNSYVYLGRNTKNNDKKAIKFVKYIRKSIDRIEKEVEIMRIVHHPNIIRLEDSFRYDAYMCIITPYAKYQNLQQFIQKNYPNGIPEKFACNIFKQMAEAVNYLHKLNICHRDIKLENFLVFDSDLEHPHIALSDFGLSIQFSGEEEKGDEFCGTLEYMAPEILNYDPYDEQIDIWSLGISLHKLLTQKLPFSLTTTFPREMIMKIQSGNLNFSFLKELKISKGAIDLFRKMCTLNSEKRISAEQALNHRWLNFSQKKKCKISSNSKKTEVNDLDDFF